MSKSFVEKYEQMLEQDPSSTVFVELARAYLERGDNDRAIDVCKNGLDHHPESVVGRVLWGKALINIGRAAEAMGQFDQAVNIDKDNPHAYNLIGEVLLRKGLYRSALPVLRKAAALQPNDGRIKQWLEQTRQALSGGPAPILYDSTSVDLQAAPPAPAAKAEEPERERTVQLEVPKVDAPSRTEPEVPAARGTPARGAARAKPRAAPARGAASATSQSAPTLAEAPPGPTGPGSDPDVFAAFANQAPRDESGDPTVLMQAYAGGEPPLIEATVDVERPGPPLPSGEQPSVTIGHDDFRPTQEVPKVQVDRATIELEQDAPDPFAQVPSRTDSTDTFRGLTSTFDALADGAGEAFVPPERPPPPPPPSAPTPGVSPPGGPTVIPAPELMHAPPQPPADGGGLLDDIASMQMELPSSEMPAGLNAPEPAGWSPPGAGGLLDEIPDHDHFDVPSAPHPIPRADPHSTQASEAIAREYERELRKKLEATTQKKTFLQAHGVKVGVAAGALVVIGGLVGSFVLTRLRHSGETLETAIGKGLAGIALDTKEGDQAAVESLELALTMDDSSVRAKAWKGYAHALLYADFATGTADKEAAQTLLAPAPIRDAHPELALVADALLADGAAAKAARQQLQAAGLDRTEVHTELGRELLAEGKAEEARKELSQAVDLNPRNVRALVALGDYYRQAGDLENAVKFYGGVAEQLSKVHPGRVIGMAEARLALDRETAEALSDLEAVKSGASVPPKLKARFALAYGRALSVNGKHEQALKELLAAQPEHQDQAFDFQMALGQAYAAAGTMDKAQSAYEEAAKIDADSEKAKEGLGRVLLARSREKELLNTLKADGDQRKISLLRGIAYLREGDARRARQELQKTQVGGKVPAEAAVYLVLADASEEQLDKAIATLETLLKSIKRHQATVQIALARLYMKRGTLDKARKLLEEASKDPLDYEGNAMLGELLMNAGVPLDIAIEPLKRAVARNGSHAAARHLLTHAYVSQGKFDEAQKQVDAWTVDNPTLDLAWQDAAWVAFHTGRMQDAEKFVKKSVPNNETDLEALRLKARILFARADGRTAFAALERANKLDPKDPKTFCEIGFAFVRQSNIETAMKAFEAATRENPKSLCGLVGPYHAQPSTRNKALKVLQGLLDDSTDVEDKVLVLATLARVHAVARNLKAAESSAEEATQLLPYSAVAWYARAEVADKKRDKTTAADAWSKASLYDASWASARLNYAEVLQKAGDEESLKKAIAEYQAVSALSLNDKEVTLAKKQVTALKKQLP